MKYFLEKRNGFSIYRWTTNKHDVHDEMGNFVTSFGGRGDTPLEDARAYCDNHN